MHCASPSTSGNARPGRGSHRCRSPLRRRRLPRWAVIVIGVLAAVVLVLGGAWWQSTRAPPRRGAAARPSSAASSSRRPRAAAPRQAAPQRLAPADRLAGIARASLASAAGTAAPRRPRILPRRAASTAGAARVARRCAIAAERGRARRRRRRVADAAARAARVQRGAARPFRLHQRPQIRRRRAPGRGAVAGVDHADGRRAARSGRRFLLVQESAALPASATGTINVSSSFFGSLTPKPTARRRAAADAPRSSVRPAGCSWDRATRVRVARNQQRHAVVNPRELRICIDRDDHAGLELLARRGRATAPTRPASAKRARQRALMKNGRLRPPRARPTRRSRSRESGSGGAQSFAKRRLGRESVEARVDEPTADVASFAQNGTKPQFKEPRLRRPSRSRTTATACPGVRL